MILRRSVRKRETAATRQRNHYFRIARKPISQVALSVPCSLRPGSSTTPHLNIKLCLMLCLHSTSHPHKSACTPPGQYGPTRHPIIAPRPTWPLLESATPEPKHQASLNTALAIKPVTNRNRQKWNMCAHTGNTTREDRRRQSPSHRPLLLPHPHASPQASRSFPTR